jgi:serine phosphatase RsbU (regulator of sigma subunit)
MVSLAPGGTSAELRLAGHPPPLLLSDAGPEALAAGPPGPPLGILDDARWPARALALPPVWSLLLFTDGVMDGRIGDGPARLGEAGLAEVVSAAHAGAEDRPDELVRLVVERAEDLNGGPLADDVALVLMARRAA